MKSIRDDLADRLALLHLRHDTVFSRTDMFFGETEQQMATDLKAGLRTGDAETVKRVRALIDPADLLGMDFWGTELGRWLFAAGGYVDTALTRTLAALVLDCSRQWIHELVTRGTLKAAPSRTATDREVWVDEVRNLLKARLSAPPKIDKQVK